MKFALRFPFALNIVAASFLFLSLFSADAMAQQGKLTLSQLDKTIATLDHTYAVGKILTSVEAEKAIGEASVAKIDLQNWFVQSEVECYEKFFVTSCLNDIKLIRRTNTEILQRIIVEAKALQRLKHMEQLDQRLMDKNSTQ